MTKVFLFFNILKLYVGLKWYYDDLKTWSDNNWEINDKNNASLILKYLLILMPN